MTEQQMRELIRKAMNEIGSLRAAAKKWKVSPAYLSDCLNGRRNPGPAILRALGYERVVVVMYQSTHEAEANARLRDAVPDLLAACELWDQGFAEGELFTAEQFRVWVNKNRAAARAAIAKAKGESRPLA